MAVYHTFSVEITRESSGDILKFLSGAGYNKHTNDATSRRAPILSLKKILKYRCAMVFRFRTDSRWRLPCEVKKNTFLGKSDLHIFSHFEELLRKKEHILKFQDAISNLVRDILSHCLWGGCLLCGGRIKYKWYDKQEPEDFHILSVQNKNYFNYHQS